MLKNWDLKELRQNGMKYESAAAGERQENFRCSYKQAGFILISQNQEK